MQDGENKGFAEQEEGGQDIQVGWGIGSVCPEDLWERESITGSVCYWVKKGCLWWNRCFLVFIWDGV